MLQNEKSLQEQINHANKELAILYNISNAMRTTLELNHILYIILTGVTAHTGLGFNRAILFLVNNKDRLLEGKMVIGPDSGEQAPGHRGAHVRPDHRLRSELGGSPRAAS